MRRGDSLEQMTQTGTDGGTDVGTAGTRERAGRSGTAAVESPPGNEGDGPLLSFFIPDLTVGGAEQVTVSIVNGLAARGYNIELVLSRFDGELRSALSADVSVVVLRPSKTSVAGVAAHLPALAAYVRRHSPAGLFPHLSHPSSVALLVKRLLDTETAVIPTHHSAFGQSAVENVKDRIDQWLVPRLYPTSDRLIAVSEGVADSLSERTPVGGDDITVLHNPIDVESVRERARDPVDDEWLADPAVDVVLFVGRHADQKNLETWLRAFERISEQNPDARGIVAGKGPERSKLAEMVERRGLGDRIALPGYVDNPYRYMAEADVFMLSSRYEGLPTVLIESLAVGCPVVSTDCPSGPRTILQGGEYGRLVPVGDDRCLADAALETLSEPPDADRLRARADDFSHESVFDEYEAFLHEHVLTG